jgi:N-acetylmuramoyl-L-alanine amidase
VSSPLPAPASPIAVLLLCALDIAATACGAAQTRPPAGPPPVALAVLPDIEPVVQAPSAALPPEAPGPLAGRRVCIDPGHDGRWVPGATGRNQGGAVPLQPADRIPLHEHELTLSVAYRLKALLEAEGALVCVTRTPREEGGGLQVEPYDFTGDGRVRTAGQAVEDGPERTQPRIDWANAFGAEVLISIHFNGLSDPAVRGTEAYYTDAGARAADGRRLAAALVDGLLAEMAEAGYPGLRRGVFSDLYQRYSEEETRRLIANNQALIRANGADPAACRDCYRLLTLGNNPMSLHRGEYLGALVEVEFLSNPAVVEAFIARPDSLDIVARGLLRGTRTFFGES